MRNLGNDDRLTLPVSWTGQRYFTPERWREIKKVLRQNPNLTLEQLLTDELKYLPPF